MSQSTQAMLVVQLLTEPESLSPPYSSFTTNRPYFTAFNHRTNFLIHGQPFPALVPDLQAPVELIAAAEAELTGISRSLPSISRGIHMFAFAWKS